MADKVIRIKDHRPQDAKGHRYTLHRGNVLDVYSDWEAPDLIVSDGAYGVREFQNLALGRLAEAEEEYKTKTTNDVTIFERKQA